MTDNNKVQELSEVNDFLISLMILKEAEQANQLDPFFKGMGSELGATHAFKPPYAMVSASFTQQGVEQSKKTYPDLWAKIHEEISTKSVKDKLHNEAGYSLDEIREIPDDILRNFAVVERFEQEFPDAESKKYPLADRLRDGRDQLLEAISSKAGQNVLTAVSLGISFATGGIVTKLAVKGGVFVASQIVKNEAVQDFASKFQERAGQYLEKIGVPTRSIAERFGAMKDSIKGVLNSPTFQKYGKPSLALAGVAIGALMLGEVNHEKLEDLASSGFAKGADLAHAGMDLGSHAVDAVSNVSMADVGDWVSMNAKQAVHITGDFLEDAKYDVRDFAYTLTHNPGELVASASQGIKEAAVSTGDTLASAADSGRQSIAHGLNKASEYVTSIGAGDVDPGAHPVSVSNQGVPDDLAPVQATEPAAVVPAAASNTHHIAKGESLWKIAHDQFVANGVEPTNSQIQEASKALYEANKEAIGANPDLIFAGRSIEIDPQIFGAHHAPDVSAPAPVAPVHEQVKALKDGGGLAATPNAFRDMMEKVVPRVRSEDVTPGM